MYDILFIGSNTSFARRAFNRLKERFPLSKGVFNNNVDEAFEEARKKVFTKMFWVVWEDVVISLDFNFNYSVPEWDLSYTHTFLNQDKYNGVVLFPKNKSVSKKELDYRFFINTKQVEIVASINQPYDLFYVDTYEDYLKAMDTSNTIMTWLVPKETIPTSDFPYTLVINSNSGEFNVNHVFKNQNKDDTAYNGAMLVPTTGFLTRREIEYRFPVKRKEYDIIATRYRLYDIVFISYNEPNAEENYQNLLKRFPNTKRVDNIKGIHNAHIEAAKLSVTSMFWVVDGDAQVLESFNFDHQVSVQDLDCVHVWQSRNPINSLEYGYGGVKLLPRELTLTVDTTSTDMTMSISNKFKVMEEVSNITAFNTDAFTTWRSAFRECCKLTIIDNEESLHRLYIWCTTSTDENATKGALAGRDYGRKNAANLAALNLINDFDWLQDQFNQQQ